MVESATVAILSTQDRSWQLTRLIARSLVPVTSMNIVVPVTGLICTSSLRQLLAAAVQLVRLMNFPLTTAPSNLFCSPVYLRKLNALNEPFKHIFDAFEQRLCDLVIVFKCAEL